VNRAVLLPAAMAELDKIAIAIKAIPNSRWEIGGYTSNTGSVARNTRLSGQRADAVKNYLVSKGVDAASLTAMGYGPQRPVGSNRTAKGRAENMRVEIKRLR
jgi:OOP family OmpA-OmpF porin